MMIQLFVSEQETVRLLQSANRYAEAESLIRVFHESQHDFQFEQKVIWNEKK